MDFSDEQIYRYSRHIILPEVGGKGQRKLLESQILLFGAAAVGSAAALYLTAAGVGQIGIVDGSTVSLSDLQSQILHSTQDLNLAKSQSAREKLARLNPDVQVNVLPDSLITDRPGEPLQRCGVLLDATEDAACHYALNQTCVALSLPLIVGDAHGFRARIQTIVPGQSPCYRCLNPSPLEPPRQAILGALGGVVGSLLATETIKLLLKKGRLLSDRVLEIDLLAVRFSLVPSSRDPNCPVCGRITTGA